MTEGKRIGQGMRQEAFFSAFLLGLCLCFYLFFAWFDGAVICVDSPSYIEMDLSREPLYCLLLAAFRTLFLAAGEDFYLTAVAYFQSVLAAVAAWSLVGAIRRECGTPKPVAFLLLCMPLAVSLLCRFAARRGSMYSNSILTEGITIPLYLLFFRYLLEYWLHQTKKSLILGCVITFLMISARKQMAVALVLLIFAVLAVKIRRRKPVRGAALAAVLAAGILGGSLLLDLGYNSAVRQDVVRHSSDGRFITTMAFYTAERDDAQYIEDEEIRELFLQIYDACDAQGYLKHSAGEGWLNRVTHFGDYYDCIQIDTMCPAVNEFVRERYGDGDVVVSENADRIMGVINVSVLPHNLGKLFGSFLDNFLSGLITTVAQRNPILNWYSLFAYLFYLLLFAWILQKGRQDSRRGLGDGTGQRTAGFAGLVLLSIVLNVGLVSLVIFCQTRYTIYNMALFYMALILMLYEWWRARGASGSPAREKEARSHAV